MPSYRIQISEGHIARNKHLPLISIHRHIIDIIEIIKQSPHVTRFVLSEHVKILIAFINILNTNTAWAIMFHYITHGMQFNLEKISVRPGMFSNYFFINNVNYRKIHSPFKFIEHISMYTVYAETEEVDVKRIANNFNVTKYLYSVALFGSKSWLTIWVWLTNHSVPVSKSRIMAPYGTDKMYFFDEIKNAYKHNNIEVQITDWNQK